VRRLQPDVSRPGDGAPLVVPAEANGLRLDVWLGEILGIGRRAGARLTERARVNGSRRGKGARVATGDEICLDVATPEDEVLAAEELAIRTSRDAFVLDKPAGLPTTAIPGRAGPSVAAWLAERHPECATIGRPGESGLVHRLDTATSGVLLAARSSQSYDVLREQFHRHAIEKTYLALVHGRVDRELSLDAAIGQHPKSRRRMRIVPPPPAGDRYASQPAHSIVEPVRAFSEATLVRVRTQTGVRHQVRVHLASAGHSLLGDVAYGGEPLDGVEGHLLHAETLAWRNVDGVREEDRSALPSRWEEIMARLV
jgi:23S rRNA pseudouridine1911/1915/1917 synthase